MQKKQSTIRNANIMGMLLMYLFANISGEETGAKQRPSHKLRNHGSDATESWTSTS
jgi:hypothetical protein